MPSRAPTETASNFKEVRSPKRIDEESQRVNEKMSSLSKPANSNQEQRRRIMRRKESRRAVTGMKAVLLHPVPLPTTEARKDHNEP